MQCSKLFALDHFGALGQAPRAAVYQYAHNQAQVLHVDADYRPTRFLQKLARTNYRCMHSVRNTSHALDSVTIRCLTNNSCDLHVHIVHFNIYTVIYDCSFVRQYSTLTLPCCVLTSCEVLQDACHQRFRGCGSCCTDYRQSTCLPSIPDSPRRRRLPGLLPITTVQ